jgi:hypothetical protein
MRKITITIDDDIGFDIEENGKICNGLSWDEMLGQIAMLTVPPARVGFGFAMRTPKEWAEHHKRYYQLKNKEADYPLPSSAPSNCD